MRQYILTLFSLLLSTQLLALSEGIAVEGELNLHPFRSVTLKDGRVVFLRQKGFEPIELWVINPHKRTLSRLESESKSVGSSLADYSQFIEGTIAIAGEDSIDIIDLDTGKKKRSHQGLDLSPGNLAVTKDGKFLFSASYGRGNQHRDIWLLSDEKVHQQTFSNEKNAKADVPVILANGKMAFRYFSRRPEFKADLRVSEIGSEKPAEVIYQGWVDSESMAAMPDGRLVISAEKRGAPGTRVELWIIDPKGKMKPQQLTYGYETGKRTDAKYPNVLQDGRILYVVSNEFWVIDPETMQKQKLVGPDGKVDYDLLSTRTGRIITKAIQSIEQAQGLLQDIQPNETQALSEISDRLKKQLEETQAQSAEAFSKPKAKPAR